MSDGDINPMGGISSNPFANPFGSGNPFANSLGGSNPFGGGLNSLINNSEGNDSSDSTSFNVDDLVKKIDAKIAELEEEEKREKELEENKHNNVIEAETDIKDNISDSSMYEDGTDSDDFFDDFFSDD